MSVLQTIKEAVGIASSDPNYRCEQCGHEFEHSGEPGGSYWFSCPECGNETESEFTSLS